MAQIKDIKARIKGIKGTQKITKAMKSISLIRLQKAEARALASRPFIYAVTDMVSRIEAENVYYERNRSKDALFVIFTSDRGLCGAFNENLLKLADAAIALRSKTGSCKLILVGTKAVIHYSRKKFDIVSTYTHLPPDPTASLSDLVMNDCKKLFLNGTVSEVVLIYNNFKSKLKHEVKVKQLLPLPKSSVIQSSGIRPVFMYQPDMATAVKKIIEMFLESTVFHSFLDLYASEYSARLMAMTKATDSAQEIISDLTLEMNKTRQALITKELLEVISGAEALAI